MSTFLLRQAAKPITTLRKVHNSKFNTQNSKFIIGIALGIRYLRTIRPVRATLNKTLFNYTIAVNPLIIVGMQYWLFTLK